MTLKINALWRIVATDKLKEITQAAEMNAFIKVKSGEFVYFKVLSPYIQILLRQEIRADAAKRI